MTIHPDALADPIPAACARLGVSRSTIYLLFSDQKLRAIKVRGKTLVTRAEQARFIASLSDPIAA